MQTATTGTPVDPCVDDHDYDCFLAHLQERFDAVIRLGGPLFTTSTGGLYEAYLASFPEERRQHYTCNACRRFIETYGGLVTVNTDGSLCPVLWTGEATDILHAVPLGFIHTVNALRRLVAKGPIEDVALFDAAVWGQPKTGEWRHMAIVPPPNLVYKPSRIKTTSQAVAEKHEEHGMLCRGLVEFPREAVAQAVTMLDTDALYRSEKCLGVARWLLALHHARDGVANHAATDNLMWLATATAPTGFCHVRSTMISTLLDDIVSGMPFDDVKGRFDAKMRPDQYQRPQAPPKAGNLARAEVIVAELRAAGALDRRFARLADLQTLWTPSPPGPEAPPKEGSVFGHLKAKGASPAVSAVRADLPPVTVTWEKFARTVLPNAQSMAFYVPSGAHAFSAYVMAANPDAPPILQWDRPEKRNTVSAYAYTGGSLAVQWGLAPHAWEVVTAVSLLPSMWDPERAYAHQGCGVVLLLQGAQDTRDAGNAIFPEMLRSEFHEIRSTIEAYSRAAKLTGREEADACGITFGKGGTPWRDCLLRVTLKDGSIVSYKLDRWD